MNIFLVEDNPVKRDQLLAHLSSLNVQANVRTFSSYNSALQGLEAATPDLLILDMTLPTFDRSPGGREGRNRPLGGYEIMKKLERRHSGVKVIVVSQFESFGEGDEKVSFKQLMERCRLEFPDTFLAGIHFRVADAAWQPVLKDSVLRIVDGR